MVKKSSRSTSPLRSQSHRIALEPRIVFDAVIPGVAAELADQSHTETQINELQVNILTPVATSEEMPLTSRSLTSPNVRCTIWWSYRHTRK